MKDLTVKQETDCFTFIDERAKEKPDDRKERVILDLVEKYSRHPAISDKTELFRRKMSQENMNAIFDSNEDEEYLVLAKLFRHPTHTEHLSLFNDINKGVALYEKLLKSQKTPTEDEAKILINVVASRQAIMIANQGLVIFAAKNLSIFYSQAVKTRKISRSDIVQMGNKGLARAIVMFDTSKGLRFSTYAVQWIQQSIEREYADTNRTIRLPVHVAELVKKVEKHRTHFIARHHREPSIEEAAEALGTSQEAIARVRGIHSLHSLNKVVGDGSAETGNNELGDFIEDERGDVFGEVNTLIQKRKVLEAIHTTPLSQAERTVLLNRYNLTDEYGLPDEDCSDGSSLKSISEHLGISYIEVRRLERSGLRAILKTGMLSL